MLIIKPVNRPLQDKNTPLDEIQYPDETWCVQTHMYAEVDGGMKLWFEHLKSMEAKGCETVYLYDIKAQNEKIVNGTNKKDWIETILYFVRADYKKFKTC
jgi:hypothetical protein